MGRGNTEGFILPCHPIETLFDHCPVWLGRLRIKTVASTIDARSVVTCTVTKSPLRLPGSRITRSPSVTSGGERLDSEDDGRSAHAACTAALRLGRMRGLAFPTDPINQRDYSAERETPNLNGAHEIPIDPALAGPTVDPAMVAHDWEKRTEFVRLLFFPSFLTSVIGPPSLRREII